MTTQTTQRPTPVIRKEIAEMNAVIDSTHRQLIEQMRRRSKLYDELDNAMDEKYA